MSMNAIGTSPRRDARLPHGWFIPIALGMGLVAAQAPGLHVARRGAAHVSPPMTAARATRAWVEVEDTWRAAAPDHLVVPPAGDATAGIEVVHLHIDDDKDSADRSITTWIVADFRLRFVDGRMTDCGPADVEQVAVTHDDWHLPGGVSVHTYSPYGPKYKADCAIEHGQVVLRSYLPFVRRTASGIEVPTRPVASTSVAIEVSSTSAASLARHADR